MISLSETLFFIRVANKFLSRFHDAIRASSEIEKFASIQNGRQINESGAKRDRQPSDSVVPKNYPSKKFGDRSKLTPSGIFKEDVSEVKGMRLYTDIGRTKLDDFPQEHVLSVILYEGIAEEL